MEIALIVAVAVLAVAVLVLLLRFRRNGVPEVEDGLNELRTRLDMLVSATSISAQETRQSQEAMKKLPREVLESITGSLSKRSGRLHELMATFELTQYDRLFYLGEPVDFVGIKYDEGVDFIEVKSGKGRLSADEKRLRYLIDRGCVRYVQLSVERIGVAEEVVE